jgi:LacI family transcriptional regulator
MGRRAANTRVGIADVAARAGVSLATVSRVMNRNDTVDPGIADRVRAAAAELKYQPNPIGRNLALGKTDTIGIVVPDLANPSFQGILRGLSRAAARDGYRVLIADSSEVSSEESILAGEARRRCDGVVLCAPRMSAAELAELAPSLHPLVLVNRTLPDGAGETVPSTVVDYGSGVRELAAHLIDLGHRRLAFLAGPERSASNALRLNALNDYCAEHTDVHIEVIPAGSSFEAGHDAVERVRASGVTAVLAFNDLAAMGLLSGLHEAGVRVPEDISVTGFDDIPFARYTTPPLTTAAVPINDVGEQAWYRMRELLNGTEGSQAVAMFEPSVAVRGSTGLAPAS